MPKVSIIVPVYNVEIYIRTCIDSILAQSLTDIEIICVDDGSTDSSPAILDEYARRDRRIKVIHKPNRGYGNSINAGFDVSTGEYIGIVESDDYILPDMYEILYRYAVTNDLDLIKSECIQFWDTINYSKRVHIDVMEDYFGKVLLKEDRLLFYQFYMNTWTGIYKRSFLEENGIRHNETPGAAYQDNGFWIQTMSMCSRAMWLDAAFYMYRQDNPAASVKSRDKVLAMYHEYCYAETQLERKGLKQELSVCRYYRIARHKGTFIRIGDVHKKEYAQLLFRDWDQYYDEVKDLDIQSREELFNWICDLRKEGRVEQIIAQRRAVKEKIDKCDRILLYGAGNWAENVCLKLYNMGCYDKVETLCVSKVSGQVSLCGREVIPFDKARYDAGSLFIIAVKSSGQFYKEIKKQLKDRGIRNYIDADTIVNHFYMV